MEVKKDFSSMSDEELRGQYSSIRALINRVEKKIDAVAKDEEVTTIYKCNEEGAIELVEVTNIDKQQALYEMQEIVQNLEEDLAEIEENYKGFDLKSTPVLDPMEETGADEYSDLSVDNPVHGRKL